MFGAISSSHFSLHVYHGLTPPAKAVSTPQDNTQDNTREGVDPALESTTAEQRQALGQSQPLTDQEQKQLQQLQQRDREVRAHEAAHQAVAGALGGAAHFELKTGADGKRYAVGGEVSIDSSKVNGDPRATLAKANRIKRAALAPLDPSAQDRAVAAKAAAMAAQAIKEIFAQQSAAQARNNTIKSEEKQAAAGGFARRAISAYHSAQTASNNAALHLMA